MWDVSLNKTVVKCYRCWVVGTCMYKYRGTLRCKPLVRPSGVKFGGFQLSQVLSVGTIPSNNVDKRFQASRPQSCRPCQRPEMSQATMNL